MSTTVVFNGSSYSVPAYGDTGWAAGSGNLSLYLVAIASGTLQTTGGTFTLSAEVDFGATYGLKAAYFKSRTATPATAGIIRLASSDTIDWQSGGNNTLGVSGPDIQWNGSKILTVANAPTIVTENSEVYIAGTPSGNYTGSLTVVNLTGTYTANGKNLRVFINGLKQDVTYDYAETSTSSFTMVSALNTGDRISTAWLTT